MKFKKLEGCVGCAPKIQNQKNDLGYQLWVDEDNDYGLYVQITENEGGGKYSDKLFSVAKYAPRRNSEDALKTMEGYDADTGKKDSMVRSENNGGFIKAILRHLLPDNE